MGNERRNMAKLRKLLRNRGINKRRILVLPRNDKEESLLDICSKESGGCDSCKDLVECRRLFDSVC